MTEPHDLILERLKPMDDNLGRMDDRFAKIEGNQRSMLEELRAHKSLIAGALHSQSYHEANLAELVDRVERIERRLELREER